MKENKLSNKALKQLKEFNITEADVLAVCPVDLSLGSDYLSGYMFLTGSYVGLATIETPADYLHYFRGIKNQPPFTDEDLGDYEVKMYELTKLAHVHLDRGVGSIVVTAEYDGEPVSLAALTYT